jgi:outer membrane protein TolC
VNRQRAVVIGLLAAWWCAAAHAHAQSDGLTLEQAIERALAHNEQPRIADQRAQAAQARVDRARSMFYPNLNGVGSYLFRPFPAGVIDGMGRFREQDPHTLSGTIGLSVSVFEPRAFPLLRQAKLENAAADLRADESRRVLAFDVARTYITVLGLEQVMRAAEQRVGLAELILAGAQSRFEAGLSSSNDITRAELELATARRELARSRGDTDSARYDLGFLIGGEVKEALIDPPAALSPAAVESADSEALRRAALGRRKDLAAADKDAEALDAAADEPTMRWFPSLALTSQYRATTQEAFGRNDELTAGFELRWQIWDGGERTAERAERLAQATASELERDALARRIGVDVRQALTALERGQAEAREAEATALAARRNMEETRELYLQGLRESLAVADAALQLFSAEVELVRVRYGIGAALLDLRAVLGLDPLGKEPPR